MKSAGVLVRADVNQKFPWNTESVALERVCLSELQLRYKTAFSEERDKYCEEINVKNWTITGWANRNSLICTETVFYSCMTVWTYQTTEEDH